jgi:hypothetical protein
MYVVARSAGIGFALLLVLRCGPAIADATSPQIVAGTSLPPSARPSEASNPPLDADCLIRPIWLFDDWIGASFGVRLDHHSAIPSVEARAGGGVTLPLVPGGVWRAGAALEARVSPFWGVAAGFATIDVVRGELPRRLLEAAFHRSLEGALAIRAGVGLSVTGTALATFTLSYGLRSPAETWEGYDYQHNCRGPAETVVDGRAVGRGTSGCGLVRGLRFFVSATARATDDFDIVGGIEFDPWSLGGYLHPPRPV